MNTIKCCDIVQDFPFDPMHYILEGTGKTVFFIALCCTKINRCTGLSLTRNQENGLNFKHRNLGKSDWKPHQLFRKFRLTS